MKKVIFGIDIQYTKTKDGWKKSKPIYPKWSEITESQPIKDGQTTVMRMGEEFGIMCLDLDTKDPDHPDYEVMCKIYELAPTKVQESQNGFHFFYKWDKRLAKSASKITNGDSKLDIKSNMGLISIKAPVDYYHWWEAKSELQEFTDEMWEILRLELTKSYLGLPLEKHDEIKKLDELISKYEQKPETELEKRIERQQKKIDNYDKVYKANYNDTDIQRARDYPIRQLLNQPTAKLIKCISPDHNDKTPSMQITGNFAYCHGCGEHFDSISIYQILHDCDFITALKALK
jgi:hypothetical protein